MKKNIENLGNNQTVIFETNEEGNKKVFFSYNSLIAEWKDGSLTLGIDWDYSKTTLKYLYIFLRTYTNTKYKSKKEIEKAIKENEIKINEEFKHIKK